MARTGRLAWIVWGVGILAYCVAIMQRTSLGVPDASGRRQERKRHARNPKANRMGGKNKTWLQS